MKDLAQLRSDAHTIFYSGVKAADPGNAVQRSVKVTSNFPAIASIERVIETVFQP